MNNNKDKSRSTSAPPSTLSYSPEQMAAYYEELAELLLQIKEATNHYEVLGIDALATTGEVKLAYTRLTALLHPRFYNLDLPQPQDLLSRVDRAFETVSTAYSVLVNFNRRVEYDDSLFGRQEPVRTPVAAEPGQVVQPQVERRRAQRFQLSLPVQVTGHSRETGKWQEMTQTIDVSVHGALMAILMPVEVGMILNISMPMPTTLRNHTFFEVDYEVYAIIRRLQGHDEDTMLIGVEFFSDEPPSAYFDEPWARFTTEPLPRKDRRTSPRSRSVKSVNVEYLDAYSNLISRELGMTEDVSKNGIRVRVKDIPDSFARVKVTEKRGSLASFATVTGRYVGDDGLERLCLKFVEG